MAVLPMDSYAGKVVACNASMMIYQAAVATQFESEGNQNSVSDEAGITSAHLVGLLNKTVQLLDLGIRPIWVFDGSVPSQKALCYLEKRDSRGKGSQSSRAPEIPSPPVSLICEARKVRTEVCNQSVGMSGFLLYR